MAFVLVNRRQALPCAQKQQERSPMTHEEKKRLRVILIIEGCPWEDLDALVEDFQHKPDILHSFLSDWTPETESNRPQDDALARLGEAARYLLDRRNTTEEERSLATAAIEWLRSKRDGPKKVSTQHRVSSSPPAGKRKRKLCRRSGQP